MKNKALKAIIAAILIIVITMSDFVLVGLNLVTYALENIDNSTSHDNVKFAAYFKTENGESLETEYEITDEEMKLYMKVEVENDGYFDGVITLEDSNFKLKQAELPEGVSKIEENTITLNTITKGKFIELEVGIEPIVEESYSSDMLNKQSVLNLTGEYKDSTEENISVEAKKQVTLNLLVPTELDTVLEGKVITNKIYTIDEENKRLVQLELNSAVIENVYPIKTTTFEVMLPETIEAVEVISKGTYATNGDSDKKLDTSAYVYDQENNVLTVTIENQSENGKISWKKDAIDSVVVTLILDDETEITEDEYNVKAKVQLQGQEEKVVEKEIKYNLAEESDGIIKATIENEEEIYKGKIYLKEQREYNTVTKIEVNYANLVEDVSLKEKTIYRTETEYKEANIEYVTTIISKDDFDKVLGTDGKLVIKDQNGNVIKEITAADFDENETLTLNYGDEVKELTLEMTKAIGTGIITLNHTKVINAEEYEREEITALKYLVEQATAKYGTIENKAETEKELGETTTVAELSLVDEERKALSTVEINEQFKMGITLKTDGEQYDLYQNPLLTIKLPEGVTNVSNIKTIMYHLSNFTAETPEYNSDTREIKIKLNGAQTQYNVNNTNGYIQVSADIEMDEKVPSRQDVITLTYTNENAIQYQNGGTASQNVNISGSKDLVLFNQITNYNLKTNSISSKEEQIGNLKMYQEAAEANFQIALVNNTGVDLKDVKVIGNLPVEGEVSVGEYNFNNTIASTLKSEINIEAGQATIYYTSNKTATTDLNNTENGWNKNLSEVENPILYMIVMSSMNKETNFIANYTMNIPANLEYGKDMKTTYQVVYSSGTGSESVDVIPVGLETGKVSVRLEATVGADKLEDGMTVKAGEVIRYKIVVNNTGSEAVSNVNIVAEIPEGTAHVKPVEGFDYYSKKHYEETNKEKIEETIDTLLSGQEKIIEYEVRAKSDVTEGTAENQAIVTYNDSVETKSEKLTHKLESGDIRVTVKRIIDVETVIFTEKQTMIYALIVENISDVKQENIDVNVYFPEMINYFTIDEEKTTKITIDSIDADDIETEGQENIKSYEICMRADDVDGAKVMSNVYAIASCEGESYRSNSYDEYIYGYDVEMQATVSREGEYLKANDIIEYEIKIINNSEISSFSHRVEVEIPNQLTIQKIEEDGQEIESTTGNYFSRIIEIPGNSERVIKITAIVNYSEDRDEIEKISSTIKLTHLEEELQVVGPICHYLEANPEDIPEEPEVPEKPDDSDEPQDPPTNTDEPENPTEPDDPTEPENPEGPTEPEKKKYNISGKVWIDQDQDGEMNNSDKVLKDIQIKLLNLETNQFVRNEEQIKDLVATTEEDGYYKFDNIVEGKYMVVFEYDTTLYKPTIYIKEGIAESKNSNVISKILDINGEQKEYAVTNEIELNKNITNINMGLVFTKKFDIEVEKYVSKVIVQTSKETTTYDYQDEDFAKVEINAKRIVGSTILVQYTIKVTNVGDVDAYVNSLVDYAPVGLKFSSELNTDWYESGENLYTNSLKNGAIAPGETKEVNLVLTKTKTDGNAELINNMAEIQEAYNTYGIADINSKEANQNKEENDFGSADLMISIQTGTAFNYIIVVLSMLAVVGVAVFIINKKVLDTKF